MTRDPCLTGVRRRSKHKREEQHTKANKNTLRDAKDNEIAQIEC
jgi:hypothetical protein